jgi:hypothetical protein
MSGVPKKPNLASKARDPGRELHLGTWWPEDCYRELLRIFLPRTPVNKGKSKGPRRKEPWPSQSARGLLRSPVGLGGEPTTRKTPDLAAYYRLLRGVGHPAIRARTAV